jgi:5-methylcytosine-specific restriction endonuclease McrA
MNEAIKQQVRTRAGNCCEYCQLSQADSPLAPLHIEHVLPRKHGGSDDLDNLALACIDCNLHKGSNIAGIDPESGQVTALFNPRRDRWDNHFAWQDIHIVGKSAVGRATVIVLDLNSEDQLGLRSS